MQAATDELGRACDALHAIPPDLPRDQWVRAGMAAHAAGVSFDEFDRWSACADNYDPRAARDTWRSFEDDGRGIGAGTLFMMAQSHGWQDRASDRHRARPIPKAAPKVAPVLAAWNRFPPATTAHPYIAAKSGIPEGLRVVPAGDPLRIAGTSVVGHLAVPVLDLITGSMESIQFVPPPGEGKKLNMPGCPMKGVFIVGELVDGGTVYVVEGIGQAWACWKATGHAAVVCFGAGRMKAVAQQLRARDPKAKLVLVPDAGKEDDAERIATEVRGHVAFLPADSSPNFDVNDYAKQHGADALEILLAAAEMPGMRYKLLGSREIGALPPLRWRIRGVFPESGVAGLIGQSGAGKSFIALDAFAAVAEGRSWFGHRVPTVAPIIIVPLEGQAGMRQRVRAWEIRNGRPLPDLLRIVLSPFRITDSADVAALAEAALSLGSKPVVVIDTLNAAAPDIDENTSDGMGRILDGAKALQRATEGLVVLVHHLGKDRERGPRGHSSLIAAFDVSVNVLRDGSQRQWQIAKSKDGADDTILYGFQLRTVELGEDDDGEMLTSCVVEPIDQDPRADQEPVRRPVTGGNQKAALDALRPLFKASRDFGKPGAPPQRPCLEFDKAVDQVKSRLVVDDTRRVERTKDAIRSLVGKNWLGYQDGWIWLT